MPKLLSTLAPPLLLAIAFSFSLFFNGFKIEFYSASLITVFAWVTITLIQSYKSKTTINITPLAIAMLLFLAWLGISLFFTPVPYLGKMNFWWVGIISIVFIIYSLMPFSKKQWQFQIAIITSITFALAIYALIQRHLLDLAPNAVFFNKNSLAALINLVTFVMVGLYFKSSRAAKKYLPHLLLLVIFINVYLLGIIQSRAALLAFIIAGCLFFILTHRHADSKQRNYVLLTIALSLVSAFLSSRYLLHDQSDFVVRLSSLEQPKAEGFTRFIIWQPAYELFKSSPLTGIGLGAFFLALPSVHHIKDTSAGYFVHNDYLQIATETGFFGLIFLLLVCFSILLTYIKSQKIKTIDSFAFLEITALFCSLFTVAFHSLFSYNLYILPLMMLSGLFIARFHQIYTHNSDIKLRYQFEISRYLRPSVFYGSVAALFFMLVLYFSTFWIATVANSSAIESAQNGDLQRAHALYIRAQAFNPDIDGYYYADANILIKSAQHQAPSEDRKIILDIAKQKLEKSSELNPYRPHTPYLWAQYYEITAPNDENMIIDFYKESMRRNPRYMPARIALAKKYLAQNNIGQAYLTLQQGLDYAYHSLSQDLLDYVYLTAETAGKHGDNALAQQMAKRHAQFQTAHEQLKLNKTFTPFQTY